MRWTTVLAGGLLAASAGAAHAAAAIDPELLAGMRARSIGPAGMSGRVAAVESLVDAPDTIYVGAATGGLWKSVNGGLTWRPLFDDQPVAAIGAVAVFQPSPDLVWVGTGEGNPRNSVSVGNGVYRSRDGGEHWTHVGLDQTERIHRILPHPTDPDVAYVAALGKTWGENEERGVFRTVDGGATWQKILYVDERTGCADLAMDPSNPRKLIAAMWDHRRWPWFFRSGGPGSGLYVTVDGGDSWERRTPEDGLPEGDLGRIGVAFSRSHPDIVYALVEAETNVLLRSEDGGVSWKNTEVERTFGNRPFYYADLRVDPERPDRVYSLWSLVSVSDDGGKSFRVLVPFREIHPDHHAMWIHPRDPTHIVLGNDGGVAISSDRGETWRFVANLPLAQFYHIAVDRDEPFHVYGGMQDNGSWRGPSEVWENGGIRNHHWDEVGFGDGFNTLPDPQDSRTGYAMSQEGYLRRWNLDTGERRDIRPPAPDGVKLRFNWNAALAIDPFDPATIYYGSQFVHRSRDRGNSWTVISPDLTTDNPEWQKQAESGGLTPDVTGAENFTSIVSIALSPVEGGVIWVGTDDGRLHLTRDAGESWTSLEGNLRGVPPNTWIPHVEASPHDAATAFVVLDDHRRSNWKPYVLRTTNYGKSWKSLVTDEVWGYALSIVQDPRDPDLLFLGTEFGLYASTNGGKRWLRWTHGLPTVAARDLAIQPDADALVVGTHGRGAYVLDDLGPLRGLSAELLERPLHLFDVPDALQYRVRQTGASRFPGHGEFRGENRERGAWITYSLNVEGLPHPDEETERARKAEQRRRQREQRAAAEGQAAPEREPGEEGEGQEEETESERAREREDAKGPQVTIEIHDDERGARVRRFEAPARLGINRAVWNLRRDAWKEPPREPSPFPRERSGPEVVAGTYRVVVRYEDHETEGTVRVLADPRQRISERDRRAKWTAITRGGALRETLAEAIHRIHRTRSDVETAVAKARQRDADRDDGDRDGDGEDEGPHAELYAAAKELQQRLKELERQLWVPPGTKGIVAETDVRNRLLYAYGSLTTSWHAPTPGQLDYLRQAEEALAEALETFNAVFRDEVAAFRERVRQADIRLLPEAEPLAVP